jgi:hypothetical protein
MALKIEEACSADSEKNVTKNVQRALAELMETLEGLRPNYETFEKNFLKISYKPAESLKIKYILLRINQRIDSGEIDWNTDNVNIEHLLPQEPEKWGYKKADVQEFVDNIGNLTLISKSKNSQMQNEPLETKMETLKTSKVEMTKKLVQEICEDPAPWDQRWNEGKIRAKAKEYSKFAYENVWNFKKLK